MLELKKIRKSYTTGDFTQEALKGVDLNFRQNEFVAVLGQSGSGKTTLLNIIGGLDRYTDGDLVINGKSTKSFKDKDWDAYRNNCIGFVFQSYNLISHIDIVSNVEMGMTLSGVSPKIRKQKALEVLERVGLKEHTHKRPNQLSGGQMQRVAIARALANDPDIILADEPTGALDSETSVQIMDLIKEIAKDKLVIMVTHNPELAHTYANRIVELRDGEVISDTNPITQNIESSGFSIRKTAMSYFTALRLSFNNIRTKKGRTIITSFASSIGIIGIALILALSNGFQVEIDKFERDSLSQMPVQIMTNGVSLDVENMMDAKESKFEEYSDSKEFVLNPNDTSSSFTHRNNITSDYIKYIEDMDQSLLSGTSYTNGAAMNVLTKDADGNYTQVEFTNRSTWSPLPEGNDVNPSMMENNYDVLAGELNSDTPQLSLIVDANNQVSESVLKQLGYEVTDEPISFEELMGKEFKVVLNNAYYKDTGFDLFIPNTDLDAMANDETTITVKVGSVVRGKASQDLTKSENGIMYNQALTNAILDANKVSDVVKAQEASDVSVLSGQAFETGENAVNTKDATLSYLGAKEVPTSINIYPKDFDSKDQVLEYLDAYNEGKADVDVIQYTDMASMISSLSGNIMGAITIVLIAFSAISLIVSSIMIGIITYTSVLERTKEIGILRALGARKKDITRVFNAETMIIGVFSGLIGIGIALLLTIPANAIIETLSGLADVAKLNPMHAVILIIISLILTLIGGLIPAKMAAKKDPVEALRSE